MTDAPTGPWVKVPCEWWRRSSNHALATNARAWAFSGRNAMDGMIPKAAVPLLVGDAPDHDAVAQELVAAGAWLDRGDNYELATYLDWNGTAAEIEAKREANRKRVQQWREKQERDAKPQKPSKPKRKKPEPIAPDWAPTEEHRKFASEHSIDLDLEVVKFRGHYDGQALPSVNGRFSTWLGNAVTFDRKRTTKQAARGPAPVSTSFDESDNSEFAS